MRGACGRGRGGRPLKCRCLAVRLRCVRSGTGTGTVGTVRADGACVARADADGGDAACRRCRCRCVAFHSVPFGRGRSMTRRHAGRGGRGTEVANTWLAGRSVGRRLRVAVGHDTRRGRVRESDRWEAPGRRDRHRTGTATPAPGPGPGPRRRNRASGSETPGPGRRAARAGHAGAVDRVRGPGTGVLTRVVAQVRGRRARRRRAGVCAVRGCLRARLHKCAHGRPSGNPMPRREDLEGPVGGNRACPCRCPAQTIGPRHNMSQPVRQRPSQRRRKNEGQKTKNERQKRKMKDPPPARER